MKGKNGEQLLSDIVFYAIWFIESIKETEEWFDLEKLLFL